MTTAARLQQGSPAALIVHADDLGLTDGVNAGIFQTFQTGIVRSASLMTTTPGFDDAVVRARATPGLDLGIHLNLTTGRPCLPATRLASLVDRQGCFHSLTRWLLLALAGRIDGAEVQAELTAQVDRAFESGLVFSHLDSHHHIHLFEPATTVVADLGRRHHLLIIRQSDERRILGASRTIARLQRPPPLGGAWRRQWLLTLASRRATRRLAGFTRADFFTGLPLLGAGLDAGQVSELFMALPAGTTELMCHPGYGDALLRSLDPGAAAREREVALLTNPALPHDLEQAGIQLIACADLLRPRLHHTPH